MESIAITVTAKTFPAEGKKQGKITDQTGKTWQVWGNELDKYTEGQRYEIKKYKTSAFRGITYYQIEEAVPVGQTVGSASNGAEAAAASGGPTSFATSTLKVPVSDGERQLQIFICGTINNVMSNPTINPMMLSASDIAGMITKLKDAWKRTMVLNQDMNDDIPF